MARDYAGPELWDHAYIADGMMKMNWRFLPFAILSLVCLGAPGFAHSKQVISPGATPEKLENMDYFHARKIILGFGWRSLGGPCQQVSVGECDSFPEIGVCSGVFPGYCSMVFVKPHRCLYVVTSGGEPAVGRENDTHVENLTFRRGACAKN